MSTLAFMSSDETADVGLAVDCAGSGAPALIFVHGSFCDRHDWSAQMRALADRFRVVSFDMPGHGESVPPAQPTIEALARGVSEVVARYGGGHAVLIGHSLGVDVSLEAFRQSPGGIAGLVLIDSALAGEGDPELAVRRFEEFVDAVGQEAFLNAAFSQMFLPGSDPQVRARVLSRLEKLDTRFARGILSSKVHWDASRAAQVLTSVNVPLLLLQSTYLDDKFQRRSLEPGMTTPWMDLVRRKVPGAEVRYVPNAGHFAQIDSATLVNDLIGEFAGRLRGPA
jgi:pimeloyl-ACP methyl ester carboxylesterase